MTITADQIYALNKMNSVANQVQLGTLIQNAETITASEVPLTNTQILVGNASNLAVSVALSGDATIANTGALTIANSAVTNVKVSAAAAIDFSKLAALTSGNVLVGNVSNVAASVAVTGDVTLSNAGLVTVVSAAGNFNVVGKPSFGRTNVASAATIASLPCTSGFIKLTGSTATDLQGIAAGISGQILRLWNPTGQNLTIRNASASAASGEKITTSTGADIVSTANGAAEFVYDTDASPAVWVCMNSSL